MLNSEVFSDIIPNDINYLKIVKFKLNLIRSSNFDVVYKEK